MPLSVPTTLLRHHARGEAAAYVRDQTYFSPTPTPCACATTSRGSLCERDGLGRTPRRARGLPRPRRAGAADALVRPGR
ncbi:DUF1722 domain-containing protein [Nonomuraea thailandensis]